MNLLIILCLLFSGGCEGANLDDKTGFSEYLSAAAGQEVAGPVEQWRPLVEEQFPAAEVDTAMCIIRQESNGDPQADNPNSSARGLFQILASLWAPYYGVDRSQLYDPAVNVALARDIWESHGWWAWSPYKRGACR